MLLNGFVNHGSDEDLLKSLQNDENVDQEELVKALDKSKLVQVERQVQGKNKMFTRKQWVKAGDVQSTDKVIGGQQPQKDDKSKYVSIGKKDTSDINTGDIVKLPLRNGGGYNIFEVLSSEPSTMHNTAQRVTIKYLEAADHRIKVGENGVVSTATWDHGKSFEIMKKQDSSNGKTNVTSQTKQNSPKPNDSKSSDTKPQQPKQKSTYFKADQATKNTVNNIAQKMGNDKLLSWCHSVGVTWTENDHKGINIMRAKMALAQAIQEGKVSVSPKTSGNVSGYRTPQNTPTEFITTYSPNGKPTQVKGLEAVRQLAIGSAESLNKSDMAMIMSTKEQASQYKFTITNIHREEIDDYVNQLKQQGFDIKSVSEFDSSKHDDKDFGRVTVSLSKTPTTTSLTSTSANDRVKKTDNNSNKNTSNFKSVRSQLLSLLKNSNNPNVSLGHMMSATITTHKPPYSSIKLDELLERFDKDTSANGDALRNNFLRNMELATKGNNGNKFSIKVPTSNGNSESYDISFSNSPIRVQNGSKVYDLFEDRNSNS